MNEMNATQGTRTFLISHTDIHIKHSRIIPRAIHDYPSVLLVVKENNNKGKINDIKKHAVIESHGRNSLNFHSLT